MGRQWTWTSERIRPGLRRFDFALDVRLRQSRGRVAQALVKLGDHVLARRIWNRTERRWDRDRRQAVAGSLLTLGSHRAPGTRSTSGTRGTASRLHYSTCEARLSNAP